MLVLNLDGFRDVNDQLGQTVGDRLLTEVSRRLVAATRAHDLVARIGGDEFAILLIDSDPHIGETIATRLREAFEQPFLVDDLTIDLEVSIGAAAAEPGDDVTIVLRNADSAMYSAKRERAGFRRFTPRTPPRHRRPALPTGRPAPRPRQP